MNSTQMKESIGLQSTQIENFRKQLGQHNELNQQVPSLSFSNCAIDIEFIQLILVNKHLLSSCTTLTLCNIHPEGGTSDDPSIDSICLQQLFDLLSKICISFNKVQLQNVQLNQLSFSSFVKFIKLNQIEDLVMQKCSLTDANLSVFCNKQLFENKSLTNLSLKENKLTAKSQQKIFDQISKKRKSSIECIDLTSNEGITSTMITKLNEAITTLESSISNQTNNPSLNLLSPRGSNNQSQSSYNHSKNNNLLSPNQISKESYLDEKSNQNNSKQRLKNNQCSESRNSSSRISNQQSKLKSMFSDQKEIRTDKDNDLVSTEKKSMISPRAEQIFSKYQNNNKKNITKTTQGRYNDKIMEFDNKFNNLKQKYENENNSNANSNANKQDLQHKNSFLIQNNNVFQEINKKQENSLDIEDNDEFEQYQSKNTASTKDNSKSNSTYIKSRNSTILNGSKQPSLVNSDSESASTNLKFKKPKAESKKINSRYSVDVVQSEKSEKSFNVSSVKSKKFKSILIDDESSGDDLQIVNINQNKNPQSEQLVNNYFNENSNSDVKFKTDSKKKSELTKEKEKSFETDQKVTLIKNRSYEVRNSEGVVNLINFEHAKKLSMNIISPNAPINEEISNKTNKKQCLRQLNVEKKLKSEENKRNNKSTNISSTKKEIRNKSRNKYSNETDKLSNKLNAKKSAKKLTQNHESKDSKLELKKNVSNGSQGSQMSNVSKTTKNSNHTFNNNSNSSTNAKQINIISKVKKKSLNDFDEKVSDILSRINNGIDHSHKLISNKKDKPSHLDYVGSTERFSENLKSKQDSLQVFSPTHTSKPCSPNVILQENEILKDQVYSQEYNPSTEQVPVLSKSVDLNSDELLVKRRKIESEVINSINHYQYQAHAQRQSNPRDQDNKDKSSRDHSKRTDDKENFFVDVTSPHRQVEIADKRTSGARIANNQNQTKDTNGASMNYMIPTSLDPNIKKQSSFLLSNSKMSNNSDKKRVRSTSNSHRDSSSEKKQRKPNPTQLKQSKFSSSANNKHLTTSPLLRHNANLLHSSSKMSPIDINELGSEEKESILSNKKYRDILGSICSPNNLSVPNEHILKDSVIDEQFKDAQFAESLNIMDLGERVEKDDCDLDYKLDLINNNSMCGSPFKLGHTEREHSSKPKKQIRRVIQSFDFSNKGSSSKKSDSSQKKVLKKNNQHSSCIDRQKKKLMQECDVDALETGHNINLASHEVIQSKQDLTAELHNLSRNSNIFIDVNNNLLDNCLEKRTSKVVEPKGQTDDDLLEECLGFSTQNMDNILVKSDQRSQRSDHRAKQTVHNLESSNFNKSMQLGDDIMLMNIQDVSSERSKASFQNSM